MKITETVICPGCGWIGDIDQLANGDVCPDCGWENNAGPPWRLLSIGEMLNDPNPYTDIRMDLFLTSLSQVVSEMHLAKGKDKDDE